MSLSDCVKCWDTPCTCGWDYRDCQPEILREKAAFFTALAYFIEANGPCPNDIREPEKANEWYRKWCEAQPPDGD